MNRLFLTLSLLLAPCSLHALESTPVTDASIQTPPATTLTPGILSTDNLTSSMGQIATPQVTPKPDEPNAVNTHTAVIAPPAEPLSGDAAQEDLQEVTEPTDVTLLAEDTQAIPEEPIALSQTPDYTIDDTSPDIASDAQVDILQPALPQNTSPTASQLPASGTQATMEQSFPEIDADALPIDTLQAAQDYEQEALSAVADAAAQIVDEIEQSTDGMDESAATPVPDIAQDAVTHPELKSPITARLPELQPHNITHKVIEQARQDRLFVILNDQEPSSAFSDKEDTNMATLERDASSYTFPSEFSDELPDYDEIEDDDETGDLDEGLDSDGVL